MPKPCAKKGDGHTYGEKQTELVLFRCVTCQRWLVVRIDSEDLQRHLRDGIYVQHAFVRADGTPYLDSGERELFISSLCKPCWSLLCPSDKLAYS